MRWLLFLPIALYLACSATHSPGEFPPRPMVASLEPIPGNIPAPVQRIDPNAAPGVLLEQGLYHFSSEEHEPASEAFRAAISTGRLNDAGRALAYWHIFIAEQRLGETDRSSEALGSFVVVAEDIIGTRDEVRYAVSDAGDFVDRFDLPGKLERGRAILSATWANRANAFGRSADRPVPVRTEGEMAYFLEISTPCGSDAHWTVSRREIVDQNGSSVQMVTMTCGDSEQSIDYFFDML